ncbi:MAG: alpha-1,2-fucosyltransferase [bacterium]
MIIVKLQGGLGNQMFQYACGKNLAKKHNTELVLDTSFLLDHARYTYEPIRFYDLDIFDLNVKVINGREIDKYFYSPKSWFLSKFWNRTSVLSLRNRLLSISKRSYWVVRQTNDHFNEDIFPDKTNLYLDGFWQSPKFFQEIEKEIRKDFTIKNQLIEPSEILTQIKETNSVCINVRRGDFVDNPVISQHHGSYGLDYLKKAEKIIADKIDNPHFFITSDDVEWCKENIRLDHPQTIIDHSYAGKKFSNYLHLMISCKHFIIPNSSFAWWAAWLSPNPDKIVIAPKMWLKNSEMNDLIPSDWIRI